MADVIRMVLQASDIKPHRRGGEEESDGREDERKQECAHSMPSLMFYDMQHDKNHTY
jgi:hypothetical protein